jgi:hypothetical protein
LHCSRSRIKRKERELGFCDEDEDDRLRLSPETSRLDTDTDIGGVCGWGINYILSDSESEFGFGLKLLDSAVGA